MGAISNEKVSRKSFDIRKICDFGLILKEFSRFMGLPNLRFHFELFLAGKRDEFCVDRLYPDPVKGLYPDPAKELYSDPAKGLYTNPVKVLCPDPVKVLYPD